MLARQLAVLTSIRSWRLQYYVTKYGRYCNIMSQNMVDCNIMSLQIMVDCKSMSLQIIELSIMVELSHMVLL